MENTPKEKEFVQEEDDDQTFINDFNEESNKSNIKSVKMDFEENSVVDKDIIEIIPKEKDFVPEEDDYQKVRMNSH